MAIVKAKYQAMNKFQLASLAGVSTKTFARWCRKHQAELSALDCPPRCKTFTPAGVRFALDNYGIILEE